MIAFSAGGRFAATCSAVEAAPGNAHHADLAAAPGLRSRPGDDVAGVLQFLLGVFVLHQPVGIAVAAHVDAQAGIAVAGEIRMGQRVARRRAVALAVGQVLEDRRHRILVGIGRHPDPRRQPAAVRHDDAHVGEFDEVAGKSVTVFMRAHVSRSALSATRV